MADEWCGSVVEGVVWCGVRECDVYNGMEWVDRGDAARCGGVVESCSGVSVMSRENLPGGDANGENFS